MKKLLYSIAVIFVLVSCEIALEDTTVVNNSSRTIEFSYPFYETGLFKLDPGAKAYTKSSQSKINIVNYDKRVGQSYSSRTITVYDLPQYKVHAQNKTSASRTMTADGWMDDLVISANSTNIGGLVYTENPTFTVKSDNFPLDVQWQFVDDIFYVVIRD